MCGLVRIPCPKPTLTGQTNDGCNPLNYTNVRKRRKGERLRESVGDGCGERERIELMFHRKFNGGASPKICLVWQAQAIKPAFDYYRSCN